MAVGGGGRLRSPPRPGRAVRRLARPKLPREQRVCRGTRRWLRAVVRRWDAHFGARPPAAGAVSGSAGQSALCSPCTLVAGRAPSPPSASLLPLIAAPGSEFTRRTPTWAAGFRAGGCGRQRGRAGGVGGRPARNPTEPSNAARRLGWPTPHPRGGTVPSVRRRVPNLPSSSGGSRGGFDVSHPASGLTSGGPERPTVPPSNVTNP